MDSSESPCRGLSVAFIFTSRSSHRLRYPPLILSPSRVKIILRGIDPNAKGPCNVIFCCMKTPFAVERHEGKKIHCREVSYRLLGVSSWDETACFARLLSRKSPRDSTYNETNVSSKQSDSQRNEHKMVHCVVEQFVEALLLPLIARSFWLSSRITTRVLSNAQDSLCHVAFS